LGLLSGEAVAEAAELAAATPATTEEAQIVAGEAVRSVSGSRGISSLDITPEEQQQPQQQPDSPFSATVSRAVSPSYPAVGAPVARSSSSSSMSPSSSSSSSSAEDVDMPLFDEGGVIAMATDQEEGNGHLPAPSSPSSSSSSLSSPS
ncbi:unnamed protein product, partial [Ectocarpus sp. 12 AP-2014]